VIYDSHIILDLEFNPTVRGKAPLRDEIIEIGAIKLDSEYNEISRFSCFVRPQYNPRITPAINKLTGICDRDVKNAPCFAEAMELFTAWAGTGRCRVYSWSESDLYQILRECAVKNVEFPAFMGRWLDLQRVWQRIVGLPDARRLSLKNAAAFTEIGFDDSVAHRAMYDSEVTADILMWLKLGYYREARARRAEMTCPAGSHLSSSIGTLCPGLSELMARLSA